MARQQVNTDLGSPEALRTTARPVSTASPTYSVGGSSGAALMRSLAGVKPELNAYLQEMEGEFREAEEARAYDAIQGMTYEQSSALVASGDMRATESPWFKAAFDKQFGLAHASRRRREIVTNYNNEFDKHGGDVEGFLANYAADDAEKFGDNKHIMSGLREGMSGVFGKVKDDQAEFTADYARSQVSDNFLDVARGAFDQAMESGTNPMEAIRNLYGGHNEMLGLTFPEMDDYVMQLAEERALAGDLEGTRALLEYEAVGADGTPVGAFTQRQRFSLKAQQLIERAEGNAGSNLRSASTQTVVGLRERAAAGQLDSTDRAQIQRLHDTGAISNEMHESLLMQHTTGERRATAAAFEDNQQGAAIGHAVEMLQNGRGYALRDVTVINPFDGSEHTWSSDDLREMAATEMVDGMLANNATPQQVSQHMAEWGVDYTYEPFENAMSHGYLSLTEAVAAAGANGKVELPEPALAGYQTWKGMNNQPRLRDRHIVNAEAGSVYRDAAALERTGTYTAEEALYRSASIDRKGSRSSLSSVVDRDRFYSAVTKGMRSGGFMGIGRQTADNGAQVARWMEESVRVQMDLGMTMDAAIKEGLKSYQDSHEVINGISINIRDNFIPPNFEQITNHVIAGYAEQTGEDAGDITLYPSHDGSDNWIMVYKGSLAPVSAEGHTGRFHISQLQDSALGDTRDIANEAIRERQESLR